MADREDWDYPPSGGQIEDTVVRQILEALRGVNTPPISLSQSLNVTGPTTVTSLAASGNATVGGTLEVTGAMSGSSLTLTGALSVQGNTTLGNANSDATTVQGSLTQSGGAWSLSSPTTGTLATTGNQSATAGGTYSVSATGAGTLAASAWTVTGAAKFNSAATFLANLTVKNSLETLTRLFVDSTNGRTIVGTATALTSATDDLFSVIGGRAYFAGNSGPAIGIRYSAADTVGWGIGVAATGANQDLLFYDDGGTEILRVGDTSSTLQAKVTGALAATVKAVIGGTTFSGAEELRVVGQTRLEGTTSVIGATVDLDNNQSYRASDGTTQRNLAKYDSGGVAQFAENGATGAVVDAGYVQLKYNGTVRFSVDTTGIGFYGTTPVAKPNVVGAKGGNVALANLMTALAGMGLVIDSTT